MSVPLPARRVLMPIYAMATEVARAPWVTSEPMIAEMRLQWWRDALEEIAAGGVVRSHEVVTPLALVLPVQAVPVLDAAIEARRWEIYRDPFADWDALRQYLRDTTGAVMAAASMALGDPVPAPEHGFGVGLSRYLPAVPQLMAQGRRPLPDLDPLALQNFCREGELSLQKRSKLPAMKEGFLARATLGQAIKAPEQVITGYPQVSALRRSILLVQATCFGA